MICPTGKAEYFCRKDWTGKIRLKGFRNLDFWRNILGAIIRVRGPSTVTGIGPLALYSSTAPNKAKLVPLVFETA
jgi:hypothetical protein